MCVKRRWKNNTVVIAVLLTINGCSYPAYSYHAIHEEARKVNWTDGIDKREAVVLAQEFILNKGMASRLYSLKPSKVEKSLYYIKDGVKHVFIKNEIDPYFELDVERRWIVCFRHKEGSHLLGLYPVMPFFVEIDLDTGEILRSGLRRDDMFE